MYLIDKEIEFFHVYLDLLDDYLSEDKFEMIHAMFRGLRAKNLEIGGLPTFEELKCLTNYHVKSIKYNSEIEVETI